MSRRIANQLILWRWVARPRAQGLDRLVELLPDVLAHGMQWDAQRLSGKDFEAELLAREAALIAHGRIEALTMYAITRRYERMSLLPEAVRRRRRLQAITLEQQTLLAAPGDPGWPTWLLALFYLLVLTRRAWTYLSLHGARDARQGWLGHLSEVYLGDRSRQSNLSRAADDLDAVIADLDAAVAELDHGGGDDPVERLLAGLNARALGQPLESSAVGSWLELGQQVAQAVSGARPPSSKYATLSEALAELRDDHLGAATPLALAALGELVVGCRRLPGPPWEGRLADWLSRLPARPRNDRPPVAVLQAICVIPPPSLDPSPSPAEPSPSDLEHTGVYDQFFLRAGTTPLRRTILASMWETCVREDVLAALRARPPQPRELSDDLLETASQLLEKWDHYVERLTSNRREPDQHDFWLWVEIPGDVRQSRQGRTAAGAQLRAWSALPPGRRSPSWLDEGDCAERPLLSLLLSATLDDFSCQLADFYRSGALRRS
jgi:hypothetical protein